MIPPSVWSRISTWVTDAGHLDVIVDMVNRQGHRQGYEDLVGAAEGLTVAGARVRVAGLEGIIASKEHAAATMPPNRGASSVSPWTSWWNECRHQKPSSSAGGSSLHRRHEFAHATTHEFRTMTAHSAGHGQR